MTTHATEDPELVPELRLGGDGPDARPHVRPDFQEPGSLTFVVHGLPAPQGSKRHVGRGIMVESSKRVRPWREAVKHAALETWQLPPLEGPVELHLQFVFRKPKSAPKRKPVYPTTRSTGDLDKLSRSTLDALVEAHVMLDDSQVTALHASKAYAADDQVAPLANVTLHFEQVDPTRGPEGQR